MKQQIVRVDRPHAIMPYGYSIRHAIKYEDGSVAIAKPSEYHRYNPNEFPPERDGAMAVFDPEATQMLMDELWKAGIRPSDIGTPGHLAATKEHLNDMRKLVSKSYGLTL